MCELFTVRKPKPGKSLAEIRPDIAKEWSSKNELTPFDVYANENKCKRWWICPSGHRDYEMSCRDRNRGSKCPLCWTERRGKARSTPPKEKSLGVLDPSIISTWSPKNTKTPFEVYPHSHTKYYWTCPNGHDDYEMSCSNKTKGKSCPKCSHNGKPPYKDSFGYLYPEIAKTWSDNNNCSPWEVYPQSSVPERFWICLIHGEYEQRVSSKVLFNYGCPECGKLKRAILITTPPHSKSLGDLYPELVSEWSPSNSKTPYEVYPKSHYKAKWVCNKGHEWGALCEKRTRANNPTGCPKCSHSGTSQIEQNLRKSLIHFGALPEVERIGQWEVDIYIPYSRTVVEYDGAYAHSFRGSYERDKRKSLELLGAGYRVIRIREVNRSYTLTSLNIPSPSYHEIFYENGLHNRYSSEPTEELLKSIYNNFLDKPK